MLNLLYSSLASGLGVTAMPEPGSVLHDGHIGYHLREGQG